MGSHRTLTYRELAWSSGRVATGLLEAGARPNTLVAVVSRKGWEQVVAVLGILRAGAAFLPIDADLPAERVLQLLELGEVRAVLTQPDLVSAVEWPESVLVTAVTEADLEPSTRPPPEVSNDPGDLAYVIFTSGSTGVPKGVMIEHQAAWNTIEDINRRFGAGPRDRTLALSSLSFDLSVYDVFGLLAAGGAIVIPPASASRDPAVWARLLARDRVTVWNSVPALMEMLVEHAEGTGTDLGSTLRLVLLSGDWIPVSLPDRIRRLAPGAQVIGLGGATEGSIWSIAYPIGEIDPAWESIPYGRALSNQAVTVLDADLRPCPVGVAGDLYIEGAGVALGYWRDPIRTAERFLDDPATGGRRYRTGDRGRLMPDGNIEFLGRQDLQVKIGGFRVELGEIEAVLQSHPDVRLAAATAVGDPRGQRRLFAYVVPRREAAALSGEEVRRHLERKLPPYMVPTRCIVLDELPLTSNGKVDRKHLPAPDRERWAAGVPYAAPFTPEQELVAAVWADVLGLDRVGVHDDVFDLGGHSLLATRAATRLRGALGFEIPVAAIFRHPTVAGFVESLEELRGEPKDDVPLVPRPPDAGPAPLSFSQESVWFLDRLVGGNRAYHFQCTVRFEGDLDVPLLERALNEVVRRHESLRTTFEEVDGRPVQVVQPRFRFHLPVIDLSAYPPPEREADLTALVQEEFRTTFDLARLPLFRWTVLRLSEREHLLIQVEHHFVHDGWSLAVLWREIEGLYSAWKRGEEPDLPEPVVQYSDYAAWQRDPAQLSRRERMLGFWRSRLAGAPPPLDLPIARDRPARQTFNGSARRFTVDFGLYELLRRLARLRDASLFMTLLAAFAALLWRYTAGPDLWIGSGVANRQPREAEDLIGMIVNTIVLRMRVSPSMTFSELLAHVRDVALEAYPYQEVPFEEVVRALDPPRDLSRNPLVQFAFSFHDSAVPALRWPSVDGTLVERNNGTAKFDMNVIVIPRGEQRGAADLEPGRDELAILWEYNSDLFEAGAVDRMIAQYLRILEAMVEDPETGLAGLPLLAPQERTRIRAVNETARPYPEAPVHELFAARAAEAPDAEAIRFDGESLTYRQLDARAGRVAWRLRELGVGRETPVGVLMERSCLAVVALVAVAKAGGAYVPIDTAAPAERVLTILRDAGAPVLVTDGRPVRGWDGRVLDLSLEDPRDRDVVTDAGPVPSVSSVDDVLNVMYTSGSTGTPKGVMVTHRGVVRLVWGPDFVTLEPDDTVAQVASLGFDASTFEIWGALLNGARLAGCRHETLLSPPDLERWMRSERPDVLLVTTALVHELARSRPGVFAGVRDLLFGGEACDPGRIRLLLGPDGPDRLVHLYGPTEATVLATWHPVLEIAESASTVPIGRPVANGTAWVVDSELNLVPPGLPGHIVLGGDGLARGYVGRPAETADRFRPDPFAGRPGARLYLTGDLGIPLTDGSIEFSGRMDDQVKIRGFRVEPSEVAAVISAHPAVAASVVTVQEDEPGERRLIAYVVPIDPADPPPAAALRAHVSRSLPAYMAPSAFVPLDALPLSSNGKVDRRRLPPPPLPSAGGEQEPHGAGASGPGETGEEEMALSSIWADVLGRPRVGLHDDFFEIGGHSLLAGRVVSQLRDVLGVELPITAIFDFPTVAQLAEVIRATG